jgi:hypothetical protein
VGGAGFLAMLKGFGTTALVLACIGILFPLSVLTVVLTNKRVRDYFNMTS